MYGIGQKETDEFGTRCLLARRLVERGVRFVQLYAGDLAGWDAHKDVPSNHGLMCLKTDKPIAGLLTDLKRRGLWQETLVIWHVANDHVFLPDHPLEINFVMRPAASAAGRLVDEQGQALVGYSVSLQGPDLSPGSSVARDARTDAQGRFPLDDIPTTFRYQFVVRKAKPKPPWNDSWASAALRFDRPETDGLRAWFGEHEICADELVLRGRVSITFVTIQPGHDAWVRAFFHEGKGTSYRGIWTSDGDMLPAVPFEAPRRKSPPAAYLPVPRPVQQLPAELAIMCLPQSTPDSDF